MIGGISTMYSNYSFLYNRAALRGAGQVQNAQQAFAAQQTGGLWAAKRSASPEVPVQPVSPVRPVDPEASQPIRLGPVLREGADPAEMAVRMRIRPYQEDAAGPEKAGEGAGNGRSAGVQSAREALEEGKCESCEKRKYQDGSDDMGVSFQTPTRVAPEQAASAVRGHEQEHVVREQAKAQREDRRVVSQSVTLHSEICPECGKTYISGGTTRTVTAAQQEEQTNAQAQDQQERKGFSVFG